MKWAVWKGKAGGVSEKKRKAEEARGRAQRNSQRAAAGAATSACESM